MPGIGFYELLEFIGLAAVGQRASCRQVGYKHLLVGTKHLGRFAHEIYSTQYYHRLVETRGNLSQSQRVTYIVGEILYFTLLVVVGQNHCVLLFLESFYLCYKVGTRLYWSIDIAFFYIHLLICDED